MKRNISKNILIEQVITNSDIEWTDLVDGHVPPDAARGGEDHLALRALEHAAPLVGPQVGVEAAAADELLAALEADEGPLPSVGPRVLLQVRRLLEDGCAVGAVVLPLRQLVIRRVVNRGVAGVGLHHPV